MARGNKGNSGSDFGDGKGIPKASYVRPNQLRWLSPYLDEKDQIWLQAELDNLAEFIFGRIAELPVGYTLSSKFDDRTDRWLTTIICDRVDDPNRGIAVTGRGSTRINSLYTCFYIAAVKLEWVWMEAARQDLGDFG